jgi:hypothetical protein
MRFINPTLAARTNVAERFHKRSNRTSGMPITECLRHYEILTKPQQPYAFEILDLTAAAADYTGSSRAPASRKPEPENSSPNISGNDSTAFEILATFAKPSDSIRRPFYRDFNVSPKVDQPRIFHIISRPATAHACPIPGAISASDTAPPDGVHP